MTYDPIVMKILVNASLFGAVVLGVAGGWEPLRLWVLKQERVYGQILRSSLLYDIQPRHATYFGFGCLVFGGLVGFGIIQSFLAMAFGAALGAVLPMVTLRIMRYRRMRKLDDQLVDGVQTLASSVRAGLNLVQGIELVSKNLSAPICQEFVHLLREYEYGVPIESAMRNASERIDQSNYRLLFSALQTHRERGGDLGETLDRIAESIREIQRLEKRVETLTAQNRAAARWMGAMPAVILAILATIDRNGTALLFTNDVGKLILAGIAAMNLVGFLWIRQIVNVDI